MSYDDNRVLSCHIQGRGVKTVMQLPGDSFPRGTGLSGGQVYWTSSRK